MKMIKKFIIKDIININSSKEVCIVQTSFVDKNTYVMYYIRTTYLKYVEFGSSIGGNFMVKNNNRKKCSCCGYYTLEPFHREQQVCLSCYWVDNVRQNENPELSAEPNYMTLNEAKRRVEEISVISKEYLI